MDSAKLFYNGCPKLHTKDTTWQTFKSAFRKRFKDARTDQYHFTNLQSARQRQNESPQEFADRCRALAQKIVRKVDDPLAQQIHQENADRMLLASFVRIKRDPWQAGEVCEPSNLGTGIDNRPLRAASRAAGKDKQKVFIRDLMTR
jgi:hypothetical protein